MYFPAVSRQFDGIVTNIELSIERSFARICSLTVLDKFAGYVNTPLSCNLLGYNSQLSDVVTPGILFKSSLNYRVQVVLSRSWGRWVWLHQALFKKVSTQILMLVTSELTLMVEWSSRGHSNVDWFDTPLFSPFVWWQVQDDWNQGRHLKFTEIIFKLFDSRTPFSWPCARLWYPQYNKRNSLWHVMFQNNS